MKILRRNYNFKEICLLSKSIFKFLLKPRKLFNFFLVKLSSFFRMKKCLGLPFNVFIEPSGNCNYRCMKCERFSEDYVDDGFVFDNKNMPLALFYSIMDDIGDTLLSLRLWHYGEPFLNNDIFDMIKYAKTKDIIVGISSNLSLLTNDGSGKLIESGLDYLVISFDGASTKTYSLYHGKDCFDSVTENIKTIVRLKKKLGSLFPFIELQFIVMKENEREMLEVKNLAAKLGVDKLTYVRLDATDIQFNRPESPRSPEDILPQNKDLSLDVEKINLIGFCRNPWEESVIRYSGTVLPCVSDIGQKHSAGKLFENGKYLGLRELWNNNIYREFRAQVSSNINGSDICFNCTQRDNNINNQI